MTSALGGLTNGGNLISGLTGGGGLTSGLVGGEKGDGLTSGLLGGGLTKGLTGDLLGGGDDPQAPHHQRYEEDAGHGEAWRKKKRDPQPYGFSNKMAKTRLNTISLRNHAAAVEAETLFWRAILEAPDAAKEYLAEDCIMMNPFFCHGREEALSKYTDPSIDEILQGGEKWLSFAMHGQPAVVEIDLMAVALIYKISLFKRARKGDVREYRATVASSWRQTAGADWLLCANHVAYSNDDGEE